MRIDAHQHYWKLDEQVNNWPTPDLKKIYRDFLPMDLASHLKKHQINKTIVVQAAPNIEETKFLLKMAEQHDSIAGVVGWLDLSSEQFPEQFAELEKNTKFVGIRPMLQGLEDDQWILRQDVKKNIQILVEKDFPIDILIYPRHLPYIAELLKEFPTLRAVIDHCAKPNIKENQWKDWAEWMKKISQFDSVMCKVSGLVTEADHQSWEVKDFKRYIQHVLNCFGVNRVMFGSDWPVCLLAASYDEVVEVLIENLTVDMSSQDQQLLFGGNAIKFYKLNI